MLPALERKKEMHSFTTADTGIIVTNCKSVVVAVVDYVIIEKSMMQILCMMQNAGMSLFSVMSEDTRKVSGRKGSGIVLAMKERSDLGVFELWRI